MRFRTQVGQPNAQRGRPIRSQKRLLRVRSPIRATGRSPGTRRAGSQRTGKMAGKGIFFRFAKRALPASELRCCQAAEFARISSPSFFLPLAAAKMCYQVARDTSAVAHLDVVRAFRPIATIASLPGGITAGGTGRLVHGNCNIVGKGGSQYQADGARW